MRPLSKKCLPAVLARRLTTKASNPSTAKQAVDTAGGFQFDSRYVKRYRDPARHELSYTSPLLWSSPSIVGGSNSTRVRPECPAEQQGGSSTSTRANTASTAKRQSSSVYQSTPSQKRASSTATPSTTDTTKSTPPLQRGDDRSHSTISPSRKSRLEMEMAWGASEAQFNKPRSSRPTTVKRTPSSGKTPPKKTALLFPGTGSQYVGMCSFLLDNYKTARDVWDEAEEALGEFEEWRKDLRLHELPELQHLDLPNWKVWQKERSPKELRQIVMNGPQDELTLASNAQPAITITSTALLRTLEKEYGIPISDKAAFFAGHSSGEYSACIADKIISFKEGVKLTRLHGLLTSRTLQLSSLKSFTEHFARDEERGQMTALIMHGDSTVDDVEKVLQEIREKFRGQKNLGMVEIASFNSSLQLVLSGSRAGVLYACERLKENNIASRAADLPVSAPFHCSFMSPAAPGMTYAWKNGVQAQNPYAPLVSNLDAGLITTSDKLIRDIVASVYKPVLWSPGINRMLQNGVDRFVFVGPGKALANLARRESQHRNSKHLWKGKEIYSVATEDDLKDVSEACRDLADTTDAAQATMASQKELHAAL